MLASPLSPVRRLAVARLVSVTGTEAAYIALMALMWERTGSALWVSGALLGMVVAAGLATPLAGVLADRHDRRRVMVAADLAAAGAALAFLVVGAPAAWVALACLAAATEAAFLPASRAAVPALAGGEDRLAAANGTVTAHTTVGHLLGPLAGGLLVAGVGAHAAFAVNAASFAASALIVLSIRADLRPIAPGGRAASGVGGVGAGLAHVRRDPVLARTTLAGFLLCLGVGVVLVAELPLAEVLGHGPVGYGMLVAGWGAGAVIGALAARRLAGGRAEVGALVTGTALMTVGLGMTAVAPLLGVAVALMAVGGVGNALGRVAEQTIVQRHAPDGVRGRVFALTELATLAGIGLSLGLGGPVLAALGPRGAYALAGAAGLAAVGVLAGLCRSRAPLPTAVRAG